MEKRGRKSSEENYQQGFMLQSCYLRLEPDEALSMAEKVIWEEVISNVPNNFFTPMHKPLLEMYCKHVAQSRLLNKELHTLNTDLLKTREGLRHYDKLLRMRERENKMASSFATRLRITKQAVHPATAFRALANQSTDEKPWLFKC